MALDRWIGLVLLGIFVAYGYAAWFTMDAGLAPFMQRNPIWPSTFPKVLSIIGILVGLIIVLGLEKPDKPRDQDPSVTVYRQLKEFKLGQAGLLLGLMVAYALLLRPAGFIAATVGFLVIGSAILGERRWITMIVVAGLATGIVWYLVQVVLGIFLRPLPAFMGV
ncbi:tripartite tricarboxylate transporter TctB family protein [uncultured Tateyamaria sp.]|uniref:tripartite tricarboxylate transporter TctB family protein n=1 Tax=uncultured Tateyamaria sp. TaxID=455651 RepID=UPI002612EE8B|nr:tripartite tricarboxylate transporter TctB family protein [uncultured Tateyamaria sp.]